MAKSQRMVVMATLDIAWLDNDPLRIVALQVWSEEYTK